MNPMPTVFLLAFAVTAPCALAQASGTPDSANILYGSSWDAAQYEAQWRGLDVPLASVETVLALQKLPMEDWQLLAEKGLVTIFSLTSPAEGAQDWTFTVVDPGKKQEVLWKLDDSKKAAYLSGPEVAWEKKKTPKKLLVEIDGKEHSCSLPKDFPDQATLFLGVFFLKSHRNFEGCVPKVLGDGAQG